MLTLFSSPNTCSLATAIALEEAGADYEIARLDFPGGEQRGAAYLAKNPKGRVPSLGTPHGVLSENVAILAYVAHRLFLPPSLRQLIHFISLKCRLSTPILPPPSM